VLRLKWDFKTTFPEPTPEALDAGRISDEDTTPEAVRAIHDEHAREALATLSDLDAVLDARRRGVDPSTGKTPRTPTSRKRLAQRFQTEPDRLVHSFTVLMDVYEEVFGTEARDAFDKAVRAWHAGIEVVALTTIPPQSPDRLALFPADQIKPTKSRPRRVSARMPVPAPLPEAIMAGRFGLDEDGKPVRPGPHEVRAITEQHADKLIELLDSARSSRPEERARILESFQSGLAAYAEDFGQEAAGRLEAYVRRQASLDTADRHQR
jgi:hypothetical protein